MLILLRAGATQQERAEVVRAVRDVGFAVPPRSATYDGSDLLALADAPLDARARARLEALAGVDRVIEVTTPYQLASRAFHPAKSVVPIGEIRVGAGDPVVIAGPCAVESERQLVVAARAAREAGAQVLRGGAFKPRTSPYSFQGLGLDGLDLLARAGRAVGLPTIAEVMEPNLVEVVAGYVDVLQVGSRNMQNFPLLRAVGRAQRPVLLKRGFAATIEEWLLAAEYILLEGNSQVMLCERGVRGFDPHTRNLLDLACVPLLATLTHLPVIVDPSHATGRRDLVPPLALAAIAAGADGVMLEMQPDPARARSDAQQTITPETLRAGLLDTRGQRQRLARCRALRGGLGRPRRVNAKAPTRIWRTPTALSVRL
jgi:3-deoxy-7-phosphoheptulonate synthase